MINNVQDLNDFSPGSTLTSAQYNELPTEVQNVITNLSIALSGMDLTQLTKAMTSLVHCGNFYADVGAADAQLWHAVDVSCNRRVADCGADASDRRKAEPTRRKLRHVHVRNESRRVTYARNA